MHVSRLRPKRTAVILGGIALLGGVIVVVVVAKSKPRLTDPIVPRETHRTLEARVALDEADRHRPLQTVMSPETSARQPISHRLLADLEERGDQHGLAVALLVRGRADAVIEHLEKLPPYPEINNDRAAALLTLKKYDEALQSLEQALDEQPNHPQALWNRALVLRGLELPLAAEKAFQAVARLNEAGWAQEAANNARDAGDRKRNAEARWQTFKAACQAMISTGEVRSDVLNGNSPPILRLYFYEAVFASPTPQRVLGLLPLAQELDRVSGGTVLADYVKRTAARPFSKRRVLAEQFLKSVENPAQMPEAAKLVDAAQASGDADLLMGALVRGRQIKPSTLETFRQLAHASGDPWFRTISLVETAKDSQRRAQRGEARRLYEEAIRLSKENNLHYRRMDAEIELTNLLTDIYSYSLDESQEHVVVGLQLAREKGEWDIESYFLELLSQVTGFRRNFALARAYLEEALERSRADVRHEQYIHISLARLERSRLHFAAARQAMDHAIALGRPLTKLGAYILGDIVRFKLEPGDEEAILKAVGGGDETGLSEGERLLRKHARGRFYLTQDPPRGRAILEEILRETKPGRTPDVMAQAARAYSYAYLVMEHGKDEDYDNALQLLAEASGGTPPTRCVVAIAQETERVLWISRGPDGATRGHYEGSRTKQLGENLAGVLPADVVDALRDCEQVLALAAPPLYGRAGLLPPELAWSYHAGAPRPTQRTSSSGGRLVVADVEIDESRGLPKLAQWITNEEPGVSYVHGKAATPSHVIEEMKAASEIVLVTHGEIHTASGSAALVLAQGADGKSELTIEDVRNAVLEGSPLVSLIACSGAHSAPTLHEPYSMPAAFIASGARAVIAATVKIPDRSAYQFFSSVHARIRGGATPAAALRDERVKWLSGPKVSEENEWIRSVLAFD